MLLKLFLTFLEIGFVSFGGGLGMISIIKDTVITNNWLTEEEFLNFVAISESTPGPLAINMATFVGSSQAGFLGALLATIGVVLPSFIIILLIAKIMKNLSKYEIVNKVLSCIRPVVVALIVGTAITMVLSVICGFVTINTSLDFDFRGIIIFIILFVVSIYAKKIENRKLQPVMIILISALLGIVIYK